METELIRRGATASTNSQLPIGFHLEFKNLSYEVTKKTGSPLLFWRRKVERKLILDDVSGAVEPGDLVALMGASGAGKSTLLNVLSRRILSNDGEILINGESADTSPVLMSSSCFIQQEDVFFGYITVEEHLDQQARFRVPLPAPQRKKRVQDIMDRFSLNKSRHSRIGNVEQGASRGISGGEKKRLSVATELLMNPSIIFADEPTSGLDAFMAESVVEMLKHLASLGHTVITTIHQPSSDVFAMFNKLLLLSEGRVVYFGPRLGAIPYFLRLGYPCPPYTNPGDFLIELLAIDWERPEATLAELDRLTSYWKENRASFLHEWETQLKDKFEHSLGSLDAAVKLVSPAAPRTQDVLQIPFGPNGKPRAVPKWTTISTLLQRNIISTARNPNVVRARLVQNIVTALLAGFVYFRLDNSSWYSKAGACFFIMVNQGFMSTYTTLTAFMGDKKIVTRERDSGLYHLATYFVSKIVSDFMFQFYLPIIYVSVSWFLIGLNDTFDRFLLGVLYVWLASTGIASFGYIIASFAPNLGVAVALGPVFILPCLLVAGFVIQIDSLPSFWIWLHYLSPFVYTFSGLMRTAFLNVEFEGVEGDAGGLVATSGNQVLDNFSISTDYARWWIDIGALAAWIVLGRLFALLLFLWTNKRSRK